MKYQRRLPGGWIARIEQHEEEEALTLFHPSLKKKAYFVAKAPRINISEYSYGETKDIVIEGMEGNKVLYRLFLTFYPSTFEIGVPRVRAWRRR